MDILQSAISEGLLPAIVVAIYLTIVKIIDNKKEQNQIKITNDLVTAISKISTFLDNITDNIIDKDKEKCKVAIKNTFYTFQLTITDFVLNVIIHNNIEANKDNIIENTKHLINSEYYRMYNDLSMYIINGIRVNDIMKQDWIREIEKDVIDGIYKNNFDKEQKIFAFTNKISISFNNYIVYINNKIFK